MKDLKLIYKIAWSFHRSTGLDVDDLIQEAAYAYLLALKTYNPEKGKLCTHCWWAIQSQLKNYLKKERQYITPLDSIDVLRRKSSYQSNFFEGLSNEAQQVFNLITSGPIPFITSSKQDALDRIQSLMKKQGWSDRKINQAIEDLQIAYQ